MLKLKSIIERRKLSQTALAEELGISRPYMSLLVSGRRRPSPALLDKMISVLNVEASDLFDGPPHPGLSENEVEPYVAPDQQSSPENLHISRYRLKIDALSFALTAGDILTVALNRTPDPGDIVLATEASGDGSGSTTLRRYAPPWLFPPNPTGAIEKISDDGRFVVLGIVQSSFREIKAAAGPTSAAQPD